MYRKVSFIIVLVPLYSLLLAYSPTVYVLCEGIWGNGNGSLWSISEDQIREEYDMVGDVSQSLYSYQDRLFIINNASSNIKVYRHENSGIFLDDVIDTNGSGPREMLVHNDMIFFTNWYSRDMKILDLYSYEELGSVQFEYMPEDIVTDGESIWVSLMLKQDYSDADKIVEIDPTTFQVIEEYIVGPGPNEMVVHNGSIYISRTFYDDSWNAFYGTSRIDSNGEILIANYGQGSVCGGGVIRHNGSIYRSFNGGVAPIDDNLMLLEADRIGNFDPNSVYSVNSINGNIYFGLSDFASSNYVAVVDSIGNDLGYYETGMLPGDFVKDDTCSIGGDLNIDFTIDILDVTTLLSYIINDDSELWCNPDINSDTITNILDIIILINVILG